LHRVDHSFDRRLAPHPMRWIAGGASNALSLDQPADGLRRLGRKSLRTLDLGGETLQNDERCRTAPAGSVGRTSTRDVGAMKLGGGLRAAGP